MRRQFLVAVVGGLVMLIPSSCTGTDVNQMAYDDATRQIRQGLDVTTDRLRNVLRDPQIKAEDLEFPLRHALRNLGGLTAFRLTGNGFVIDGEAGAKGYGDTGLSHVELLARVCVRLSGTRGPNADVTVEDLPCTTAFHPEAKTLQLDDLPSR